MKDLDISNVGESHMASGKHKTTVKFNTSFRDMTTAQSWTGLKNMLAYYSKKLKASQKAEKQ